MGKTDIDDRDKTMLYQTHITIEALYEIGKLIFDVLTCPSMDHHKYGPGACCRCQKLRRDNMPTPVPEVKPKPKRKRKRAP